MSAIRDAIQSLVSEGAVEAALLGAAFGEIMDGEGVLFRDQDVHDVSA